METLPRTRVVLSIVGALALTVAAGSVSLANALGDPLGLVFDQPFTVLIVLGMLAWALIAWAARRLIVGEFPHASLNLRTVILVSGFRFVLLLAVVLDVVFWLASVAFELSLSGAPLRALTFLTVIFWLSGIALAAFLNSAVILKHWRKT